MKKVLTPFLFAGILAAGEPAQPVAAETTRTVKVNEKSNVIIYTAALRSTLITLPEGQKVMKIYAGDTSKETGWATDAGAHPTRFLSIKPKAPGLSGNVQIITDHDRAYSLLLQEVTGTNHPFDVQVVLEDNGATADSASNPPAWVPADEMNQKIKAAEDARALAIKDAEVAKSEAQKSQDKFQSQYPASLVFDYKWDRKAGEKIGLEQIYRDDKFVYIKATPQETPVVYEVKDGKPSLINFEFANNLYVIRKIVNDGYLQVGKLKVPFVETKAN